MLFAYAKNAMRKVSLSLCPGFVPAPPYAEGSKRRCPTTPKGLSQNGRDRETKAKGLLSLFFISVCYWLILLNAFSILPKR
jgi:hypothetical protein